MEQTAGEFQAASHASGQGADQGTPAVGQADHLQRLGGAQAGVAAAQPVEARVDVQVLFRRQVRVQGAVLEEHPDQSSYLLRPPDDVDAGHRGLSGGGAGQGAQQGEGGGLPRAVGAEEGEGLALEHVQVQAADGVGGGSVRARVALEQAAGADGVHGLRGGPCGVRVGEGGGRGVRSGASIVCGVWLHGRVLVHGGVFGVPAGHSGLGSVRWLPGGGHRTEVLG